MTAARLRGLVEAVREAGAAACTCGDERWCFECVAENLASARLAGFLLSTPAIVDLVEAAERLGAARAGLQATGEHTCSEFDDEGEDDCAVCLAVGACESARRNVSAISDALHAATKGTDR